MCAIITEQAARAAAAATGEQLSYAEKIKQMNATKSTTCELCRRTDQEVRSVGSPLMYTACVDVVSCERKRAEDLGITGTVQAGGA